MSKKIDVVHDLNNSDYKKLIERTAGENFKLTECKAEFDKLFKENPHDFIEQLNKHNITSFKKQQQESLNKNMCYVSFKSIKY